MMEENEFIDLIEKSAEHTKKTVLNELKFDSVKGEDLFKNFIKYYIDKTIDQYKHDMLYPFLNTKDGE